MFRCSCTCPWAGSVLSEGLWLFSWVVWVATHCLRVSRVQVVVCRSSLLADIELVSVFTDSSRMATLVLWLVMSRSRLELVVLSSSISVCSLVRVASIMVKYMLCFSRVLFWCTRIKLCWSSCFHMFSNPCRIRFWFASILSVWVWVMFAEFWVWSVLLEEWGSRAGGVLEVRFLGDFWGVD